MGQLRMDNPQNTGRNTTQITKMMSNKDTTKNRG